MATIEQSYYEGAHLWAADRYSPSEHRRVDWVLSRMAPGVRTLADIGCGNGICCNRAAESGRFARVVGVDRSLAALEHVSCEQRVSDIADLPFEDGEFDACVCLEVLEHLPQEVYRSALRELARISRKQIIITVPFRERLQQKFVSCPSCQTKFHPFLHVRSFEAPQLASLFEEHGFTCEQVEPLALGRSYVGAPLARSVARLLIGKERSFGEAVCPACGYRRSSSPGSKGASRGSSLKTFARKVWPTLLHKKWAGAVYTRA